MKIQWISLLVNVFALGMIVAAAVADSGWMLFAGAMLIILSSAVCLVSDYCLYKSEKQNREVQK